MATEVRFINVPRKTRAVNVFTAASWADEWAYEPNLHCDYCAFTANPEMARAQLTWLYGRIRRPGGEWEVVEPLEALRKFILIEILYEEDGDIEATEEDLNAVHWHGIIEDDNGEQARELTDPETARTGRQVFVAYGLDIMLQRHLLRESVAFDQAGEEVTINRALEFNQRLQYHGQDKTELGNRSADVGTNVAYIFEHNLATAEYWTTLDAVEYLLAYQPPTNQINEIEIPWEIDYGEWESIPNWDKPRVPCQGRTLRDVLNHLLNRSRLLGYTIAVDTRTEPETIQIVPFTFTPIAIDFDEDEFISNIIPANANQKFLIFESDCGVAMAALKRSTLEKFDQVVCTGDRVVSCFSLQASTVGSLEKGWSGYQQTLYEEAATGLTGYGALDGSDQEAFNKMARNTHATKRVYSYFNLPSNWNGEIVIGIGGGNYTGPYFEDPDNPGQPLPFYWPDLRFLSHLPLKTDHDYSTDAIEQANDQDTDVPDETPAGQRWEYLPPMVAIHVPETDSPGRYLLVNAMAASSELAIVAAGLDDGIRWSASVRTQDEMPGIVLGVQGQPQHVMGLNDFTGLDEIEQEEAKFDWETLIITVAVECDLYAEGVYPEDEVLTSEAMRRMTVDLGDEYKCHYVAKGTMVDIDMADGSVRVSTTGGYIRDDRPRLRSLARLVYEWYGIERQSLELVFNYVTAKLSVGDLITTIGEGDTEQGINSVVTGVKYEFSYKESAQPGVARTTITTDFAELDAKGFSALSMA